MCVDETEMVEVEETPAVLIVSVTFNIIFLIAIFIYCILPLFRYSTIVYS